MRKLIAALLFLIWPGIMCSAQRSIFFAQNIAPAASGGAITLVNSSPGDNGSTNSGTVATIAIAHTAGNKLIVLIRSGVGSTISGVSNTCADTWWQAPGAYGSFGGESTDIWYVDSTRGCSSDTVTVTYATASAYNAAIVLQYSHVAAGIDAAANGGQSATTVVSADFTPTAGDLVVAIGGQGVGSGVWTEGTGYSLVSNSGGAADVEAEELIGAAAGLQTASITYSNLSGMTISVAAFKP